MIFLVHPLWTRHHSIWLEWRYLSIWPPPLLALCPIIASPFTMNRMDRGKVIWDALPQNIMLKKCFKKHCLPCKVCLMVPSFNEMWNQFFFSQCLFTSLGWKICVIVVHRHFLLLFNFSSHDLNFCCFLLLFSVSPSALQVYGYTVDGSQPWTGRVHVQMFMAYHMCF